jgi:hypothetical protein
MLDIRVRKANVYLYKAFYYTVASVWGYYIMRDLEIMPIIMGGTGECYNFFWPQNGNDEPMFTT